MGAAVIALALAAGCGEGDDDRQMGPGQTAPAPPSTVPAGRSAEVVTNDGARLRITLAVGGSPVDVRSERCAAEAQAGQAWLPVTLTVVNLGDRTAPFPPVRLETTAGDGAPQRTLVRESAGECSPAPRAAPLGPGQSAVFTGSTPAGAGQIAVRISETDFMLTVPRA